MLPRVAITVIACCLGIDAVEVSPAAENAVAPLPLLAKPRQVRNVLDVTLPAADKCSAAGVQLYGIELFATNDLNVESSLGSLGCDQGEPRFFDNNDGNPLRAENLLVRLNREVLAEVPRYVWGDVLLVKDLSTPCGFEVFLPPRTDRRAAEAQIFWVEESGATLFATNEANRGLADPSQPYQTAAANRDYAVKVESRELVVPPSGRVFVTLDLLRPELQSAAGLAGLLCREGQNEDLVRSVSRWNPQNSCFEQHLPGLGLTDDLELQPYDLLWLEVNPPEGQLGGVWEVRGVETSQPEELLLRRTSFLDTRLFTEKPRSLHALLTELLSCATREGGAPAEIQDVREVAVWDAQAGQWRKWTPQTGGQAWMIQPGQVLRLRIERPLHVRR